MVRWSSTGGEVDWRWPLPRSERGDCLGEMRDNWERSFCCKVLELKEINLRTPMFKTIFFVIDHESLMF